MGWPKVNPLLDTPEGHQAYQLVMFDPGAAFLIHLIIKFVLYETLHYVSSFGVRLL